MNLADVIKIREEILESVVSENFLGLETLFVEFEDFLETEIITKHSKRMLRLIEWE